MGKTLLHLKILRALRRAVCAAMAWAFLAPATPAQCQDNGLTEYHVKALFLFNFAKYVQWPDQAFPDTNAPITIGIVGEDNFGEDLSHAIAGKTVNGRTVVIRHLSAGDYPQSCQILFISDSESSDMKDILRRVGTQPVLTVGEDKAFARNGGIIDFVVKDDKVRLAINLDAANKAGLKISSKLLAVADSVTGKAARP